jgi:hypothetical protein
MKRLNFTLLLVLLFGCGSQQKPSPKPSAPYVPEELGDPTEIIFAGDMPDEPVFPQLLTASLSVCWDPNPEAGVTYLARATRLPNLQEQVAEVATTETRATFTGLDQGRAYFFHVLAFKDGLFSDPSNEIGWKIPRMAIRQGFVSYERPNPSSPNVTHRLEFTRSLNEPRVWEPVDGEGFVASEIDGVQIVEHAVDMSGPQMFFRVAVEIRREGCAE